MNTNKQELEQMNTNKQELEGYEHEQARIRRI